MLYIHNFRRGKSLLPYRLIVSGTVFVIVSLMVLMSKIALAGNEPSHGYITMSAQNQSDKLIISNLENIGHKKKYLDGQFSVALQAYNSEEYITAFRIFRYLADAGHTKSEYYVGVLYDMGEGVKRNQITANEWYAKAAIKGNDRAQHNLAVAYAKGDGVEENIQMALRWWIKSARQGNTDSAYNLGILYAMGHKGLAPNHKKAMQWWHKAAVSGDAYAQFNLGTMYANSKVATVADKKNYCEALHWWKLSANNGVTEARKAIELTKDRNEYKHCVQNKQVIFTE